MIRRNIGIIRRVDDLGRIVIPKETRTNFDIKEGDALEIFVEEDNILLRKYQPGCIFCSNVSNLIDFKGKKICKDCLEEMEVCPSDFSSR